MRRRTGAGRRALAPVVAAVWLAAPVGADLAPAVGAIAATAPPVEPAAGPAGSCPSDELPAWLSTEPDDDFPRLRGDFAPFDSLLLVYMEEWADALTLLLQLVPPGVEPILLADPAQAEGIPAWLEEEDVDPASVTVEVVDLDSPWVRDYAPLQLVLRDGATRWIDTRYHDGRPSDDALPDLLVERFGVGLERVDLPLDGGALIASGDGLCATTREAIAKSGVDPSDAAERTRLLRDLGCEVLVLMPALSDERTKHADVIAQFLDAETVAIGEMSRASDPVDAALLDAAVAAMRAGADAMGRSLDVVRIPIERGEGDLYYSWVNGLRLGDTYAVPDYDAADPDVQRAAHEALADAMPDATLVPIPAEPMIHLGGAVHCITAQLSGRASAQHARSGAAPGVGHRAVEGLVRAARD